MTTPPPDDNEVDIDAVWAQIIARWDEEAPPRTPSPGQGRGAAGAGAPGQPGEPGEPGTERPVTGPPEPGPRDHGHDLPTPRRGPRDVDEDGPSLLDGIDPDEEESYEPPVPPPLPRPAPISALAWAAAIGGPVFLVFCALFWRTAPSLVVAGAVAAFAAGFVTLVLRMSDNDDDDGAVV